jgi:type 1 glutamine amidotransferase
MRRVIVCALLAACGDDLPAEEVTCPSDEALSLVVFDRENQWVHPSTPVAAQALQELGDARGWRVLVTDDPLALDDALLARTDVVMFSVTSGNILEEEQRARLERFFTGGGGFVGTHSASSTEHEWAFYKQVLVPVTFKTHPAIQQGVLSIEAPGDALVDNLPQPWVRTDEWYTFYERPEDLGLKVLLALDEAQMDPTTYPDWARVGYHPLAWTHERHGGRAFYTALGHTPESYGEPLFMQMLERGIDWAASDRHRARCGP